MNILDENILESQRQLLSKWHVPFRQIGYEVGRKGMSDEAIIPFLLLLFGVCCGILNSTHKPNGSAMSFAFQIDD